jgi:hypothetical protein
VTAIASALLRLSHPPVTTPPDSRPAQGRKVCVGERRQGDVPVPADEGAHLVLVEPNLALGLLEVALDRLVLAGDPHEIGERRACRCVGEVEGHLVRISQRATNQKRALDAGRGPAIGGTKAQSYSRGPLAPSPALRRCQTGGASSGRAST